MSTPKNSTTDLNAFAWTYAQQSGELEQDGRPVASGYSGAKDGKNNPALENVPNVGPIRVADGPSPALPSIPTITVLMFCASNLRQKLRPTPAPDFWSMETPRRIRERRLTAASSCPAPSANRSGRAAIENWKS